MNIIGIVGGVASGKSLVTSQLQRLGAMVVDADQIAHEVLREADVIQALRDRWGDEILDSGGQIIRREVARRVFPTDSDDQNVELAFLEGIMHPRIRERLNQRFQEFRAGQKTAVLDAAVMFKAGWADFCDKLVFVDASHETRISRAISRGWTEKQFEARESAQVPIHIKRNKADLIIDNDGPVDETSRQVEKFWKSLH